MPPMYTFHHIHLRTGDPRATAQYYQEMFDAERLEYIQVNSQDTSPAQPTWNDDLSLVIFQPAPRLPRPPPCLYIGLDHFGLRVDDLNSATAELKHRGATFTQEPTTVQPGIRVAFIAWP